LSSISSDINQYAKREVALESFMPPSQKVMY
jgi:hypothetical protein